jgi:hypothetical protein
MVVTTAFEAAGQHKEIPPLICQRLELPLSSTYAAGVEMLIKHGLPRSIATSTGERIGQH